jgi:hypothetical protein
MSGRAQAAHLAGRRSNVASTTATSVPTPSAAGAARSVCNCGATASRATQCAVHNTHPPPPPLPQWILVGMTEDRKGLTTVASGRCGIRHLARFLSDNEVQWGVFRVYALGLGAKQVRRTRGRGEGEGGGAGCEASEGHAGTEGGGWAPSK